MSFWEYLVPNWLTVCGCVKAISTTGQGSRPMAERHGSEVGLLWLATEQPSCSDTQKAATSAAVKIGSLQVKGNSYCVLSPTGPFTPRPGGLQPLSLPGYAFSGHPGIRAWKSMLSSHFLLPGMAMDIANWCQDCRGYGHGKMKSHTDIYVQPIIVPAKHFSHLHIDLVGQATPCSK